MWHSWTSRRPLTTYSTPLRRSVARKKGFAAAVCGTQQMVDPERRCSQPGGCHQRQTHLLPGRSPARSTRVISDVCGCFRSRLGERGRWMEEQKMSGGKVTTFTSRALPTQTTFSSKVKPKRSRAHGERRHC